jgi:ribosome-binding protein aMBF1 (putative translation factor)
MTPPRGTITRMTVPYSMSIASAGESECEKILRESKKNKLDMEIFFRARSPLVMISGKQVRAARGLLGWSQQELADRALVSVSAVIRLERAASGSLSTTVESVERTLRASGIEFLFETSTVGEGVRLASPRGQ